MPNTLSYGIRYIKRIPVAVFRLVIFLTNKNPNHKDKETHL